MNNGLLTVAAIAIGATLAKRKKAEPAYDEGNGAVEDSDELPIDPNTGLPFDPNRGDDQGEEPPLEDPCPEGFTLDPVTGMCVADVDSATLPADIPPAEEPPLEDPCPPGWELDPATGMCVQKTGTTPPPKFGGGLSLGWAPLPARPAFRADQWVSREPRPGQFYRVGRRDSLESVAARAVAELARKAAKRRNMPKEAAATWVRDVSRCHAILQDAMVSMCSGWNDELFGSPAVEFTGPWGRGLDLRPVHDDVLAQLELGRTPRRNLDAEGSPTNTGARHRPLVWIPNWSVETLLQRAAGKHDAVEVEPDPYRSGITGSWPPPAVTDRGVLQGK